MIGSGILVYTPAHRKYPHTARLDNLYPINAFNNARFAVDSWEAAKNYPRTSRKFDYRATSTRDTELPEIYIFVIGETSRAGNWGLYGYERNTTPKLDAMPDIIHFDDVLTQINATHKSVPLMLCPADALNYNEIYRQKSLISAFKQAGFHTSFSPTNCATDHLPSSSPTKQTVQSISPHRKINRIYMTMYYYPQSIRY